MAGSPVSEAQRKSISNKWAELNRQMDLPGGYPFDAERLDQHLQAATEGRFFESLFKETGELAIPIPALLSPTLAEIQKGFSFIKSIHADRSINVPVIMHLGTVLQGSEASIGGAEYERRRVGLPMLSYHHGVWLVEHQDEIPAFMALRGKVYIDLPGLEVLYADGNRNFAYLDDDGERWVLYWYWTDGSLDRSGRVGVSGK